MPAGFLFPEHQSNLVQTGPEFAEILRDRRSQPVVCRGQLTIVPMFNMRLFVQTLPCPCLRSALMVRGPPCLSDKPYCLRRAVY